MHSSGAVWLGEYHPVVHSEFSHHLTTATTRRSKLIRYVSARVREFEAGSGEQIYTKTKYYSSRCYRDSPELGLSLADCLHNGTLLRTCGEGVGRVLHIATCAGSMVTKLKGRNECGSDCIPAVSMTA